MLLASRLGMCVPMWRRDAHSYETLFLYDFQVFPSPKRSWSTPTTIILLARARSFGVHVIPLVFLLVDTSFEEQWSATELDCFRFRLCPYYLLPTFLLAPLLCPLAVRPSIGVRNISATLHPLPCFALPIIAVRRLPLYSILRVYWQYLQ